MAASAQTNHEIDHLDAGHTTATSHYMIPCGDGEHAPGETKYYPIHTQALAKAADVVSPGILFPHTMEITTGPYTPVGLDIVSGEEKTQISDRKGVSIVGSSIHTGEDASAVHDHVAAPYPATTSFKTPIHPDKNKIIHQVANQLTKDKKAYYMQDGEKTAFIPKETPDGDANYLFEMAHSYKNNPDFIASRRKVLGDHKIVISTPEHVPGDGTVKEHYRMDPKQTKFEFDRVQEIRGASSTPFDDLHIGVTNYGEKPLKHDLPVQIKVHRVPIQDHIATSDKPFHEAYVTTDQVKKQPSAAIDSTSTPAPPKSDLSAFGVSPDITSEIKSMSL